MHKALVAEIGNETTVVNAFGDLDVASMGVLKETFREGAWSC